MTILSMSFVIAVAWFNYKACAWLAFSRAEIARVKREIRRVNYENEIFK